NYDLLIAEVQNGQTPEEALEDNLPVYSASYVTSVSKNYPSSYKALDTGKVYAWKVVAKNGESFAAQSEVWTFSIYQKQIPYLSASIPTYLELKTESSILSTGLINGDTLRVKFYS